MPIDIEQCRKDTPGVRDLVHFNNAGSSLSPTNVTDAIINHLNLEQELGGYEAASLASAKIDSFYLEFGKLLNCAPEEIAYIENASRAWAIALHSIHWQEGDQIITADNEYVSNYLGLLHLRSQKKVEIVLIPCDDQGLVDLEKLKDSISPKTKMIALTHVASQRGDIQPAAEVGAIAKEFGLLYLLDACQSVGQIELDTKVLGCDFLCGTGRKYLRGPRGTGFLYTNREHLSDSAPVMVDNHSASWTGPGTYALKNNSMRFETWERFIAGQIGLATAVGYANSLGLANIEKQVRSNGEELHAKLAAMDKVATLERSANLSGIVTFQKQGVSAEQLARGLSEKKINISISKQANAQLDLAAKNTGDINRASIHYYNTSEEIDAFVTAVASL